MAFVGVNVNPKAESVAAMRQFTAAHGLTRLPNWHFLTGPARQLARVWAAYGIQVELPAPRTVTLLRTALRVGTQATCAVLTENPLV